MAHTWIHEQDRAEKARAENTDEHGK
jgi:hypothetical protein